MHTDATDRIASYLARSGAGNSSSNQVAEVIAATFSDIERALMPILGQRGVAALYARSLHLTKHTFPWLPGTQPGSPAALDAGPLTAALARQTSADAATAGAYLLGSFHEVVTTLIGPSLTERLLRAVWVNFL